MKTILLSLLIFFTIGIQFSFAQSCTPQGDQVSYGSNNVWIGYVYQGINFNTYKGYVNEGSSSSPDFNESFGGNQVNYNTNGCSVYTDTFSVRYKLNLNYTGTYTITIGGDDGVRLSIDGGNTWLINEWVVQGYTTYQTTVTLNGPTSIVLEYYENFGANEVSFNITPACTPPADNQTIYGTNRTWIGYMYQGMNFNTYRGKMNEGSPASPNFNENFGGSGSNYYINTSGCTVTAAQFSARYRLLQNLAGGTYSFVVGGDDGYRFSLDGGNTWVINKWVDQAYGTTTYTTSLSAGNYNMVLEYYQDGGFNQVSFNISGGVLALTLLKFNGQVLSNGSVQLDWASIDEVNNKYFEVQRSSDGINFVPITQVPSKQSGPMSTYEIDYSYSDNAPLAGKSYYRLKMEDLDGTVTYSSIVNIVNDQAQQLKLYPTVINNNNFYVETNKPISDAHLEVYDVSGKKISETYWSLLSGKQNVDLGQGKKIAAGLYIVRLISKGENLQTTRVVVQSN